eukprot:TRINITY_DN4183_c0_g1_i2.p1 TRINITY_DN4183_c0_g1~~TRINITY_DN4183_c0_g1_i2.p1  ORF type:complete len:187 (+),score=25.02 TRINITY_DN4183_c0_g1_i2:69-629(+)
MKKYTCAFMYEQKYLLANEKDETESDKAAEWRVVQKSKITSIGIVLCLNLGVPPPHVPPLPRPTLESWIRTDQKNPNKQSSNIAKALKSQYESWQRRVHIRYRQALDPIKEDVKKLCLSLRRHADSKSTSISSRAIFHYNGHGVPPPTDNGEIWVFNPVSQINIQINTCIYILKKMIKRDKNMTEY